MFRNILFATLIALTGVAYAQTAASPSSQVALPDMDQADPKMKAALEPSRHLTMQLPGMSHHFGKPKHRDGSLVVGRDYNERNWGVGVQLEDPLTGEWAGWSRKVSFGVMKDSLDTYGLYSGIVWQKQVVDTDSFAVDIGGGAFLFYRAVQFGEKRKLVPAPLPVASVLHKSTGIGANLVLVPANQTMPTVLYVQFTKSF